MKWRSEWLGPEYLFIISKQIVMIEMIAAGSRIATLTDKAKKQNPLEKM